jgi:hypothetical protein
MSTQIFYLMDERDWGGGGGRPNGLRSALSSVVGTRGHKIDLYNRRLRYKRYIVIKKFENVPTLILHNVITYKFLKVFSSFRLHIYCIFHIFSSYLIRDSA